MDNTTATVYFRHIYYSNGFSISRAMSADGKEHVPESKHACMQSGYWCYKQIKEQGIKTIISYLYVNTIGRMRRYLYMHIQHYD